MSWMQTYTGKAFYPLNPDPELIDPIDIAHALSMLCRYNGHVRSFYSVAEHCVLLSEAVSPANALWALLHDAAEAYVGDMVRPLKQQLPEFADAEDVVLDAIRQRFELPFAFPGEVHIADTRILVDEAAALLGPPPQPWFDGETVFPLGVTISGWSPSIAELRWTARFQELTQ